MGGAGADLIDADRIDGGDGNDVIYSDLQSAEVTTFDGADTLAGGAGDDTLFVGTGDLAFGDAGEDSFVVNSETTVGSFARIQDFDPAEDSLTVYYEAVEDEDAPVLDVVTSDNGADSNILVGDRVVAVIAGEPGLTVADVTLTSEFPTV